MSGGQNTFGVEGNDLLCLALLRVIQREYREIKTAEHTDI